MCTIYILAVYRVHWLRARARRDRWQEELLLTEHEMEWTRRYFGYISNRWRRWAELSKNENKAGHASYAFRQAGMWDSMADHCDSAFRKLCPTYNVM
jgi:hypothetical protein